MTWLLTLIPGRWVLVAALFTVIAGAFGWQTLRLDHERSEHAKDNLVHAKAIAEWNRAAEEASETNRRIEQAAAEKVRKAEDDYAKLQAAHAAALGDQRRILADNGSLRNSIAAYASGGALASDSLAACDRRAQTLGDLLAGALSADAEHANAAESNADAYRALLAAWPKDAP